MRKLVSLLSALALSAMLSGQGVDIQLKAYLQGAYAGNGVMQTALNNGNHLPLLQPYNTGIWNYAGQEALASIPAQMVDWILVDLRRTPDTAVARKAFILYSNGVIKDINGSTNLHFDVPPGQYYVAIMHRSHLSAMSAGKLSLPSVGVCDFSDTTAFPIYGRCELRLTGGVMALIAGDVNHDKMLKYSGSNNDRSLILQRILGVVGGTAINAIINGYYKEDLRMDGNVKYSGSNNDPSLIIQNLVNLTGSNAINVTFAGPVPHAFFDPAPSQTFQQCGDILTDMRDLQQYPTVQIGTQCWMAKNLNIGTFVDHTNSGLSNNGIIEKYCYDNDTGNCSVFGGIYNWNEMMTYVTTPGSQGICPDGWIIPTDTNWMTLTTFLGGEGVAGGKMKATGTSYWSSPNTGATNSSGFTALPGGYLYDNGAFYDKGSNGSWWSSSEGNAIYAWYRTLYYNSSSAVSYNFNKTFGFSVRCLTEIFLPCTPQPDQANAGPDSLNVQGTSIVLQANTPVNGSGQWTVVNGQGGSFDDDTLATTFFSGQAGSMYTLVWTISTVCGINSDTVFIAFVGMSTYPTGYVHCYPANPTSIVDVTNPVTGRTWMDRNLGASQAATSSFDTNAYGDLYQWGRFADGHQCRNSSTTTTLSSTNQPEHGSYIFVTNYPYDWRSPQNDNLWQGVNGVNNPCPAGYRLPTEAELNTERLSWSGNNAAGAFGSPLKLSLAGYRYSSDGSLDGVGSGGIYWSSTVSGTDSRTLTFYSSTDYMYSSARAFGFSVRCIKDSVDCTPQPDQAYAGPDSLNIQGTSIVLQANTPVNGSGQWSVVSGQGGVFADASNPATLFTGTSGTTYSLVWTISTICGSNSDTVRISFAYTSSFGCGSTLIDPRDGQQYPTVQIGSQCWMAGNLNIGTMISASSVQADNDIIEKYCNDNTANSCGIYGGLYQWNEMMGYTTTLGIQGICPVGWHIPTDVEWTTLSNYLGGSSVAGGKMKAIGTNYWTSPNTGASNSSGFTALGAGYFQNGNFFHLKDLAHFWSSSEYLSTNGIFRYLIYLNAAIQQTSYDKTYGFSVRCVMDTIPPCTPQPDQANAGPDQLLLQGTSVQLQANQPVNGTGTWRVYSGTGGSFADSTLNNTIFSGTAGETYQLAWIIRNACGYNSDLVTISFVLQNSFMQCGDILIDIRDGQQYPTIQLGKQCWMAKNLNLGSMIAGSGTQQDNGLIEKYCYDDLAANCSEFGGFYQWGELMDYDSTPASQGICPDGWHVPTDSEWTYMTLLLDAGVDSLIWGYSGRNAGGKMKAVGTTYWTSPNVGATNYSGFTALGSGIRSHDGTFFNFNNFTYFWSSTQDNFTYPVNRYLYYNYPYVGRGYDNYHSFGLSVRCLHDSSFVCTPQPDQAYAGPDTVHTASTSIQLQGNQALNGIGEWTITTGAGGSFADSSLYNTVFTGQSGQTYTLVWSISNLCNRTSDQVNISFISGPIFQQCGDTLTDSRDFQRYPTVWIGTQCWMAKNLNVGDMLLGLSSPSNNGSIEKYCYVNNTANCTEYGGLYQWGEMMNYSTTEGAQGICPTGWHIPASAEWLVLANYLGGTSVAGGALKETGTAHWLSPNTGATNSTGFTALPGGRRESKGGFNYLNSEVNYWSSTAYIAYSIFYNTGQLQTQTAVSSLGYTIRCVMDSVLPCFPQPDQANAGPDSLNIAADSIQLYANTPTIGNGVWAIVSGNGGVFSDSTLSNSMFYPNTGGTYLLSWTISNQCGSNCDTIQLFFPVTQTFSQCGDNLADIRDGQVYPTVQIGNQCWMAKNLNIGTMVNSIHTPNNAHSEMSQNGLIEKYCYHNLTSNCDIYGGLYSWGEMMMYDSVEGSRGICPEGWHIPTDAEWTILTDWVGGPDSAGIHLKESGTTHWDSPNTAINSSGFTALGAGDRTANGAFSLLGMNTTFFTSTLYAYPLAPLTPPYSQWYRRLQNAIDHIVINYHYTSPTDGASLRCILDSFQCVPQPDQANAGPDSLNIQGTSIVLQANTPVNGSGQWSVVSGQGGSFVDDTLATTLFSGQVGSMYTLVWTISTVCGSNSDTVSISFASTTPSLCPDTLTDARDGLQYPVVQIGNQCWMAKNLNIGVVVASIYTGQEHSDVNNDATIEKYCLNNDPQQCEVYGGLYDWNEMMGYMMTPGVQGICPAGWHVPADNEWLEMVNFLGGEWVAGGSLKEAGTQHWYSPNTGATNTSGFTALPGSARYADGVFSVGGQGVFWSSSLIYGNEAWVYLLNHDDQNIGRIEFNFPNGLSVRCVMDTSQACSPLPDPANAGPDRMNIQGNTVQMIGNQPTIGSGVWSIRAGQGGSFADSTQYNTLFYGATDEVYELVWTISNNCAYSEDKVYIGFIVSQVFGCGSTLLDARDGQQYPTIQIGSQCWMAKNLNIGMQVMSNLTYVIHSDVSNNGIIEKYCYDNDSSNCIIYGGLYDWNEMMGYVQIPKTQGICPDGWHIPDSLEWDILSTYLGGDAVSGGMLKDTGTALWADPNGDATNSTGFTAIPGGNRDLGGGFGNQEYNTTFWTSTVFSPGYAWYRDIGYNVGALVNSMHPMEFGFSIRCINDTTFSCLPQPDQADAGPDQLNIAIDSVVIQANTPLNGVGLWTIVGGNGGVLSDPANPTASFFGVVGENHLLEWSISTSCATSRDTLMVTFINPISFNCGSSMVDARDGQAYPIVLIGNQCWMAKNLNIGVMVFDHYTGVDHTHCSDNGIIEKYCFDNDPGNCAIYGGMYDWNEMMAYGMADGAQGICPDGWHIPSDEEWKILEGTVDGYFGVGNPEWENAGLRGSDAGGNLKDTSSLYWVAPNALASNSSGFTYRPAGYRINPGGFASIGSMSPSWVSTQDGINAWMRFAYSGGGSIFRLTWSKSYASGVRCLLDVLPPCSPQPDQADAGPDSLDIIGTSIQLQANLPLNGSGAWSVVSGANGSFVDRTQHNTLFVGQSGNTYSLAWTVTNGCGNVRDLVTIGFVTIPFVCGDTLTDYRDGQQYPSVLIGTQCWMAKNLNIGMMVYDDPSYGIEHSHCWDDGIIEKYCAGNDPSMCDTYGGLYEWNEMMNYDTNAGGQGVCPSGWHVPTDGEWTEMITLLGGGSVAGGALKASGTSFWTTPNTGATNSSGFSALPGGRRLSSEGTFPGSGDNGYFWTSSSTIYTTAWYRHLRYDTQDVIRMASSLTNGFSIRCLKDI